MTHSDRGPLLPLALASLLFVATIRFIVENPNSRNGAAGLPNFPTIFPAGSLNAGSSLDILPAGIENYGEIFLRNGCDVFEGRWVLDIAFRPLYTEESCPYLTQQVTCQKNGRPDLLYQNWRWEPNSCQLPKFDGVKLLEKLKGKRLMFVGDSIQRTQWESMVCLLNSAVPHAKKSMQKDPPLRMFKLEVPKY